MEKLKIHWLSDSLLSQLVQAKNLSKNSNASLKQDSCKITLIRNQ